MSYESRREDFTIVANKYKEYLRTYAFFNLGSLEGATGFDEFYWTQIFYTAHDLDKMMADRRY